MEKLGIPQNQTHWLNIFGSVYKLEMPKKDINSIQQWEDHENAAVFQSFLSFMLHELKFKASELHVRLDRSDDKDQKRFIEPLISSAYKKGDSNTDQHAQTQENDNQPDIRTLEIETSNFSQQFANETNNPVNRPQNVIPNQPRNISMVFGP